MEQETRWDKLIVRLGGEEVEIKPLEYVPSGRHEPFVYIDCVFAGGEKDRHPETLEQLDTE